MLCGDQLSEGFAQWCQYWAPDKLMPDYLMWDQFLTDCLAIALRLDGLETSHPIQVPIHEAEEVDQVSYAMAIKEEPLCHPPPNPANRIAVKQCVQRKKLYKFAQQFSRVCSRASKIALSNNWRSQSQCRMRKFVQCFMC